MGKFDDGDDLGEWLPKKLVEWIKDPEINLRVMESAFCILTEEAFKTGINPTEVRFELEKDLGRTPTLDEEYQGVLARVKIIKGPDWKIPGRSVDLYYKRRCT